MRAGYRSCGSCAVVASIANPMYQHILEWQHVVKEVFAIKSLFCIPNFVLVLLGVIFGTAAALMWVYGLMPMVRVMIPYALIFAIILFVVTAVLKARCGSMDEGPCLTSTCSSLRKYSALVMISAAIFIVFSICLMASSMPILVKTISAFVGSISFFTLLFEFLAMIFCMMYRR